MTAITAGTRRPLTDTAAMVGRSLRHSVRNVDALLTGLLLPVMLLLMFTYVFGGAIEGGSGGQGRYIDYVVPGIVLLCAGYGAASTAMSVTKDMTEGIVARFRTMNVMSSAVLTGHVTASVVRNLVSTGLVVVLALALGFRPHAGLGGWLGALGILTLFVLAMTWLAAAVGLLAKTVDAAGAFGFFVLFLPYVSSAFVPPETMPAFLRPIAEHQPVTPIIESMRSLLMGTPVGDSAWIAVAWTGGILAASGALVAVLWRRSARR